MFLEKLIVISLSCFQILKLPHLSSKCLIFCQHLNQIKVKQAIIDNEPKHACLIQGNLSATSPICGAHHGGALMTTRLNFCFAPFPI